MLGHSDWDFLPHLYIHLLMLAAGLVCVTNSLEPASGQLARSTVLTFSEETFAPGTEVVIEGSELRDCGGFPHVKGTPGLRVPEVLPSIPLSMDCMERCSPSMLRQHARSRV